MTMFSTVNSSNFSEWLWKELKNRDWSQAQLARKADVSRTTITNILSGSRQLGIDTASGIARAFGYPVDYVLQQAEITPTTSLDERLTDIVLTKLGRLSERRRQEAMNFIDYLDQQERAGESEGQT